jgi:hypothetical protein
LGNVLNDSSHDHFYTVLKQYLELATEELKTHDPVRKQHKHLLLLPFVETILETTRESYEEFLTCLIDHCSNRNVDIVLVARTAPLFGVLQNVRQNMGKSFSTLEDALKRKADGLAQLCRSKKLALFLGPGLSGIEGVFDQMLDEVRPKLKEGEKKMLQSLGATEKSLFLQTKLGGKAMNDLLVKKYNPHCYSMEHSLLAVLRVASAVSSNVDLSYEQACRDSELPLSVLPFEARKLHEGSMLLKLNGSVGRDLDFSISQDEKMRDYYSAFVQGVVGSSGQTLFVGFDLTADNGRFFKYVMDAQRATKEKSVGSAILLNQSKVLSDAVDVVTIESPIQNALLLDYLACRSSLTSSFLSHGEFAAFLSEAEVQLKEKLAGLDEDFKKQLRSYLL